MNALAAARRAIGALMIIFAVIAVYLAKFGGGWSAFAMLGVGGLLVMCGMYLAFGKRAT